MIEYNLSYEVEGRPERQYITIVLNHEVPDVEEAKRKLVQIEPFAHSIDQAD